MRAPLAQSSGTPKAAIVRHFGTFCSTTAVYRHLPGGTWTWVEMIGARSGLGLSVRGQGDSGVERRVFRSSCEKRQDLCAGPLL